MISYKSQTLLEVVKYFKPGQKEYEILAKKIFSENSRMSRIEIGLPVQEDSQNELH